jgi:dihydropteroate synthase-like protein
MSRPQIHFVTGRLAEHSLRAMLRELSQKAEFDYTIGVMPITVAALMSPAWLARKLEVPAGSTKVMLPGYCDGDLTPLLEVCSVPIELGPRDLRRLPVHFGKEDERLRGYGNWDIEIIGEINHAPRLSLAEILAMAKQLADSGADFIDVGCQPGVIWSQVGDCVRALKNEGHRVSIDSLEPAEIAPAVAAGAELVLSVNQSNREAALDWGCEVVVIPDDIATLGGLDDTIELLATAGVPLRIDPILEPIGFGFAKSLARYGQVRERYPDAEMMMGIGNITELTDVDSAGVNTMLLGYCQELGIRSVLTTEVINWARTSVRECDLARRLVYHAVQNRQLPKHTEQRLVTLRDPSLVEQGVETLDRLAQEVKDSNYRVFAEGGEVHLVGRGMHLSARDPFELFEQLQQTDPKNLDASHAFYLGFEMCKAATALTLSKQYQQDEPLDWGYLTEEEPRHRLKLTGNRASDQQEQK